jgi:hypothetical protein
LIALADEPHRGRERRGFKTSKGNDMSKKTETKKLPAYRIYSVIEENGKSVWQEIGSAWPNKDSKGLNLYYKALPLPGAKVVLRTPLPPKAKAA